VISIAAIIAGMIGTTIVGTAEDTTGDGTTNAISGRGENSDLAPAHFCFAQF